MKIVIILSVFVCLLHPSLQISKIEGDCSAYEDAIKSDMADCLSIKCDETGVDRIGCAVPSIYCPPPTKLRIVPYDYAKVYPQCCEQYLCE